MYDDPDHLLGFIGKSGGAVHIETGIEGAMFYETSIRFMPYQGIVTETPKRVEWNVFEAKVRYRSGEEYKARVTVKDLYNYPDSEVILEYKGDVHSAKTNLFLVELKSGEIVPVKHEYQVNELAFKQEKETT